MAAFWAACTLSKCLEMPHEENRHHRHGELRLLVVCLGEVRLLERRASPVAQHVLRRLLGALHESHLVQVKASLSTSLHALGTLEALARTALLDVRVNLGLFFPSLLGCLGRLLGGGSLGGCGRLGSLGVLLHGSSVGCLALVLGVSLVGDHFLVVRLLLARLLEFVLGLLLRSELLPLGGGLEAGFLAVQLRGTPLH